jgi:transcription antitermination protein NusB
MSPAPRSSFRERRTAARLAAVQALYALEVAGGGGTDRLIADLAGRRWSADGETGPDGPGGIAPDEAWLRTLVDGVAAHRPQLDPEIDAALTHGWTLPRLELLLQAILRAGAYELAERLEVPTKVVITEYLEIAHAFYAGKEPSLVNAVLDRLAPRLRTAVVDRADGVGDVASGGGVEGEDDQDWTSSS